MAAPLGKKESVKISMEVMRYWKGDAGPNNIYPCDFDSYYGNKKYPEDQFSKIEDINGYPWRLHVYKEGHKLLLEVLCDKSNEAELWQCNAEIARMADFNQHSKMYEFSSWGDNKVTICDNIHRRDQLDVMITMRNDGNKWTIRRPCYPTNAFDGIIVIGEEKKKLQVRRQFLASQSPFFMKLFFEDYKELNITVIAIKDVEFDVFSQMVSIAYGHDWNSPDKYLQIETTGLDVRKMLELAERFQLKIVEDRVVSFLLSPFSSLSIHKKLLISEQFNLPFLKNILLNRYTKSEVIDLSSLAEFSHLSPDTLQVLFNKSCIDAFPSSDRLSVATTGVVHSIFAGEPNIVLIVEENDEIEKCSPVYRISGFPWRLRFDRSNPYVSIVSLICDKSSESALWKCTATISSRLAGLSYSSTLTFTSWNTNSHEQRLLPTVEVAFFMEAQIETLEDGESYFCRPISSKTCNGILVFGEKKIEVYKESLAAQSPFFDRLFFGNFKEKDMKEIPIGDVDYEEFGFIMAVLNGCEDKNFLNCNNAERMLQLADRFELKIVEDSVVSFLLSPSSSVFSLPKKLLIGEQYNLPFLKVELISQFKSIDQLTELSESPEWKELSKETLRMLFKKFCV